MVLCLSSCRQSVVAERLYIKAYGLLSFVVSSVRCRRTISPTFLPQVEFSRHNFLEILPVGLGDPVVVEHTTVTRKSNTINCKFFGGMKEEQGWPVGWGGGAQRGQKTINNSKISSLLRTTS
jgi:hypothetical protein